MYAGMPGIDVQEHVVAQGDLAGNTFADNACAGGKGATLFRTVSSGTLGPDQGLNPDTDVRSPT